MHHNRPNKPSQHKEKDISYRHQGKKKPMPAYADYVVDGGLHISGYILSVLGNRKVAELFHNGQLQAMLKGNKPDNPNEKQADELAEKALNESEIDTFMKETEALQDHILTTGEPPERNEHRYAGLLGNGQKLDKKTKDYFEPRYGVDLAQVRIHKDAKANEMAEALNARAFTQKNDIVFNKGEYQPDTPEGKKLLAHELAHTLQPGDGIQRKEKDGSNQQSDGSWNVSYENNSLLIEFKGRVTDEAIKIENLANKIVGGTASGEQIRQIFDALKSNGLVTGSLAGRYSFIDTPLLKGLLPQGKVDVNFLYKLGFVEKQEITKTPSSDQQKDAGFIFFGTIGDFFKGLADIYIESIIIEGQTKAAFVKNISGNPPKTPIIDSEIKNELAYKNGYKVSDDPVEFWKTMMTKEIAEKYRESPKNQPKCGQYVCEQTKKGLGDEIYNKLFSETNWTHGAKAIFKSFEKNDNLMELDRDNYSIEKIQKLADAGLLIFMVYSSPDYASGHIAFVSSSQLELFSYYHPDLNQNSKDFAKRWEGKFGADLPTSDWPILAQAGTFSGITSMPMATNGWTRTDDISKHPYYGENQHIKFYALRN